jgi:uncharacterized protein (DUF2147 family)
MACRFGLLVAVLMAFFGAAQAQTASAAGGMQATEPGGIWLTQAGDAKVRVSKCGAGLCGVVVWLKDPIDPATGKLQIDDKNRNPSLAKRPIMGLSLFSGMRTVGPNKWSGNIYNADDGNTYASNISVSGPDSLRVEGCVGAICGGENWTRVKR